MEDSKLARMSLVVANEVDRAQVAYPDIMSGIVVCNRHSSRGTDTGLLGESIMEGVSPVGCLCIPAYRWRGKSRALWNKSINWVVRFI